MTTATDRRYVPGILTFVYTLNYFDQGLVSLLLQPIKEDLSPSDSALGFLTGIAFAFCYATLALPIARWADRGDPITVTAITIALWRVSVTSSLFVRNFLEMLLARIAAVAGESGCMPPSHSLVGVYFPQPGERARAIAVYWLASPLAALISFVAVGWLNESCGWDITLCVMGLPALLVAVLVKVSLIEPRARAGRVDPARRLLPRNKQVLRILWHQRSTRHLILALILLYVVGAGLSPWYAAFMMRSHGMGTAQLGIWLGLIFGMSGIAGIYLGGYVAGRWFANNERGQVRLSAILMACTVPCSVLFLLLPRKELALLALVPLSVILAFFTGPAFALMQRLVAKEMRATAPAVAMLLCNLIGMGIGPQLAGSLSDLLQPRLGIDSLRYAMLIMSAVALWAAYHLWQVGRTVRADLLAVACVGPPGDGSGSVPGLC
jgi:predicted MFS family arabinose efflux permease